MDKVAVIDYGMGNLRSVSKALEHVARADQKIIVTSDKRQVEACDRIVFPGQGAMRDCMSELHRAGLADTIRAMVFERPFLGICMGLQVLLDMSEEDPDTDGLSTIPGTVRRFEPNLHGSDGARLKVPHMGWNNVAQKGPHPLWNDIEDQARFYFVHSYYVEPQDRALVAATSCYGKTFPCALADRNLFAVQFHPEKSQHAGLSLLENFLNWAP